MHPVQLTVTDATYVTVLICHLDVVGRIDDPLGILMPHTGVEPNADMVVRMFVIRKKSII